MANEIQKIDLTQEKNGGVLKTILKEGHSSDTPCQGDMVSVHYVGTLEDGTKFDSSRDRADKFEFSLGMGQVIKAWDLCVSSMKQGELCVVVCKSDYAYGSTGSPPKIPPNATLIFEIELFSWKGEDLTDANDGGITRKIVLAGEGFTMPNEGALVKIAIKGLLGEKVFFENDELSFTLGEGSIHNIPDGLEMALLKFKKSEHSIIKLSSKYAFGNEGNKELNIPPNVSVQYDVELIEFEKCKEAYEMLTLEKLDQARILKEKGSNFFKEEKISLAITKYSKIVDLLATKDECNSSFTDSEREEINKLLLASRLNLSMCHLKQKDYASAKSQAEEAIKLDADNIKGHFRLGISLLSLHEPEEASKSFLKCLEIEKGNKTAMQQLRMCQIAVKKYQEKEKKMYSAMFESLSK